ncbi:uncharacterized protein LOC111331624 isoform X1 [Stylophora pistillata]|uniref:Uncharacterized protein n=1 Tax=Stylophora pistillata TaxID=50429 RepID=A0A2B4S610_STYPI|nr:uncharacterized protein LOC111331624 isoform X1 [Stylophora pistillata]PFX24483.1 hypothetical protein AWC38_SpisGene10916 [Stylophora pistillata]
MGYQIWFCFIAALVTLDSVKGSPVVIVKCSSVCNASNLRLKNIQQKLKSLEQRLSALEKPKVKACKFDFERGIGAWAKTGTVFNNQPTYGDNPTARSRGQPANQQGNWWIGGYENRPSRSSSGGKTQGDGPQGTLTSPPFKIKGEYISFLIGGGCNIKSIRAELIIGWKVVKRATGKCHETMTRKFWDVRAFIGKSARVKLVDFSSGGWGHINFDDLRGDISCQ